MNESEVDVNSVADQYLTDSQVVTKWVGKLRLQSTLEGKKLGCPKDTCPQRHQED